MRFGRRVWIHRAGDIIRTAWLNAEGLVREPVDLFSLAERDAARPEGAPIADVEGWGAQIAQAILQSIASRRHVPLERLCALPHVGYIMARALIAHGLDKARINAPARKALATAFPDPAVLDALISEARSGLAAADRLLAIDDIYISLRTATAIGGFFAQAADPARRLVAALEIAPLERPASGLCRTHRRLHRHVLPSPSRARRRGAAPRRGGRQHLQLEPQDEAHRSSNLPETPGKAWLIGSSS